jgi:hypothetical protein
MTPCVYSVVEKQEASQTSHPNLQLSRQHLWPTQSEPSVFTLEPESKCRSSGSPTPSCSKQQVLQ